MVGMTLGISELVVIGLCLFMFSFAISLGGVLFVYVSELLPPRVNMLSGCLQPVPSLLISYFTLDFIQKFGVFWLFMIFWLVCTLGWVLFEGLAVETKGKNNSEIQKLFNQKKFFK